MSELNELGRLEERISKIEARNARVQLEKKWETSLFRKVCIALLTYLTLALYFGLVLQVNPWVNAIVPTAGFLLSTLSLSFIKKLWLRQTKDI